MMRILGIGLFEAIRFGHPKIAHELRYLANYFWMARRWLAERRATKDVNIKLTSERGTASNGSPTLSAGILP